MNRHVTFLVFTFFLSLYTFAQRLQISLRVLDSETKEALEGCSVVLLKADSASMVMGNATNSKGLVGLKSVKDGEYVLKVSFLSYENHLQTLSIKHKTKSKVDLGDILLVPSSIALKQAVITGQMQEVEVKDDTVIFNANAFKVPEGSVLEELIKKLPGAQVADDGTITINGKKISKILVEGKEFFGNNQNMAMKNLPTEIVDKIKHYDKQSDLSRMTGIDDGNEETVIDIGIKKGMKKGWFGNLDAAYGTKKRYAERLTVNRFTDGFQASLIGSINNIGGRGGNNGNTTASQVGVNIAVDTKKVEVGGNIRLNYNKNDRESYSSSQNFVSSNPSFSNSKSRNESKSKSVAGDFKIEWRIDTLTTLLLRPSFNIGDSDGNSNSHSATFNSNPNEFISSGTVLDNLSILPDSIKVNENQNANQNDGSSYSVSANLTLTRKIKGNAWFGKNNDTGLNGRNASIRVSGNFSGNENRTYNMSDVNYYQRGKTDFTYRFRNTPSNNKSMTVGATYSEPIMRNLHLQANYSYNYSKRHSDGQTYDFGKIDSIGRILWEDYGQYGMIAPNYYEFLSDSLSRYTDNINKTHNLELSLRLIIKILNVSAGVKIENQKQEMVYQYMGLDTIASRVFTRISPTLNARFKFNRQHTLRITYRGNAKQPSMTDLFELTDNTNPLNIREGNHNLKPSFTNNVNLDYNNYLKDKKISIFGRFQFSNTFNEITNRTEYNAETGGHVTKPVNIEGVGDWNISGNIGFNTPLGWENLLLNTNTSGRYNNNVGYIYQNKETIRNVVKNVSAGENLSLTLKFNSWDIRANGSFNWQKSSSQYVAANNQNTYNFHYGLSSTGNFNMGFGFSTDIGMSSRRGYSSADMNTNELIWNAQISYRFLKKRAATVSVEAFDILQQRSNISRTISAYSQRDTQTNSVNSYFMFHFIYRLNLFGSRQGRQQLREEREFREGSERPERMARGERDGRAGGGGIGGFRRGRM